MPDDQPVTMSEELCNIIRDAEKHAKKTFHLTVQRIPNKQEADVTEKEQTTPRQGANRRDEVNVSVHVHEGSASFCDETTKPCADFTRLNVETYEEVAEWCEELLMMGKMVVVNPTFGMLCLDVWPILGSSDLYILAREK